MSADELILSLPPEPGVGTVVEFGDSLARRFTRTSDDKRGWHETCRPPGHLVSWTWVWYAATEEGASELRIVPPGPNPLPWIAMFKPVDEIVTIEDAAGVTVCQVTGESLKVRVAVAERIVNAVNKAGEQR